MAQKRLVFLVNGLANFISHRQPLARALIEQGYEVFVILPNEEMPSSELNLDFPIQFLPIYLKRKSMNPFVEVQTLWQVARYYRRLKPDVVINVALKAGLYGALASLFSCRQARVVNLVTGLGFLFISEKKSSVLIRKGVSWFFRVASRLSRARLVFQNQDDIAAILGAHSKHFMVELIKGSGVDVNQFHALPEPEGLVTVILPARMLIHKGVKEFVAAAKLLKARNVQARYVLVGGVDQGNPAAITEEAMKAWCEQGLIEWWGHQSDMVTAFSKAHIVCLPSYREGLPKALLEAAACQRALVTTDVPGCREVVCNGENGFLVALHDVEGLAGAMQQLIEDAELRQRFALASRRRAEQEFAVSIVVDQTLAVISGSEVA